MYKVADARTYVHLHVKCQCAKWNTRTPFMLNVHYSISTFSSVLCTGTFILYVIHFLFSVLNCFTFYSYRNFCNRLNADGEFKNKCINYLKNLGGVSLKDVIKRSINALLTNEAQISFNRTGSKGRHAFQELEMALIKPTIMSMPDMKATERDIEVRVANHLTNSRDRFGGRDRRKKNRLSVEPEPPAVVAMDSDSE